MKCEDCKGTGEYRGLTVVEPCQTCKGRGKPSTLPENLPDWMEDYQDKIDLDAKMQIKIGDKVYIKRSKNVWEETRVVEICDMWVLLESNDYGCTYNVLRKHINYNLTLKRWEFV